MRLPLPSLPLMWLPEGLRRSKVDLHRCTPSCCGNSGYDPKPIYFCNIGFIGETGISHHSPFVYKYSEVLHLWHWVVAPVLSHHCHGMKIYMTLRSATSTSSSTHVWGHNPRDRSTRVHPGSTIIVTTLLLDRSWAIQGCVGNNFFVI
jgi:hypothetical protein